MNGVEIWEKIIEILSVEPRDIVTVPSNKRQPLWFKAYIEKDNVYVENSDNYSPSTKMSNRRIITKKDFLTVYEYYHKWANGERNLRQEVRLLSRNTAYIFGLISFSIKDINNFEK